MDEPYIFRVARACMGGACVEVAILPGAVAVRDGKNPAGGVIAFEPAAWNAFLDDVKAETVGSVSRN